jgi:hypothetical protein
MTDNKEITIVSDGTVIGTRVMRGGQAIDQVTAVRWEHRAGELPRAEVEIALLPMRGVVHGMEYVGPCGRAIKSITLEDGTILTPEEFTA